MVSRRTTQVDLSSASIGSPSGVGFVSRLSPETLGDRDKLKLFLNGLKVKDLKQELMSRDVPMKG